MAIFNNALDLYRAVLHDIDKVSAPSFQFRDFNNWINKAIKQYCNLRYNVFDTRQQHIDDLRAVVPDPITIPLVNREADLPADYLHTLRVFVNLQRITPTQCDPAGAIVKRVCKRLTADLYGFVYNDYYQRPTPERCYYKINKNRIVIEYDTPDFPNYNYSALSIELEYMQVPDNVSITSPSVYTVFSSYNAPFPDYVWQEIVNICVRLFLENVEQQRLNTHVPINQTIQ